MRGLGFRVYGLEFQDEQCNKLGSKEMTCPRQSLVGFGLKGFGFQNYDIEEQTPSPRKCINWASNESDPFPKLQLPKTLIPKTENPNTENRKP